MALIAVIVFAVCWFAASVSDPGWVFGANYLSDLGVSDYTWAHKFFNGGCLIAGVLLALCGLGLIVSRNKMLDICAGLFAVIAGTAMALIGLVTSDEGDPHVYIAAAAIGFGFLGLIALSIRDWIDGLKIMALLTPLGIIVLVISCLIFNLNVSKITPEVETVAITVLLLLFLLQGMKFMYHGTVQIGKTGFARRHRMGFGFAGLIASVLFLALFMFAVLADGSWSFGDPVYALGSSAVSETQNFFALACIAGGFFAVIFGIGAGLMRCGCARSVGCAFIVLAGTLVIGIGMTVLGAKETYACAEYWVLALGLIAFVLFIASDWAKGRVIPAAFYVVLLFCGAVSVLIGYDMGAAITFLAIFAVLGTEGIRLAVSK